MNNIHLVKYRNMVFVVWCLLIAGFCFASCSKLSKSEYEIMEKDFDEYELVEEAPTLEFKEKRYVSAYSNIYYRTRSSEINCTVLLSIRNTSESEDIYLDMVDYYGTDGIKIDELVNSICKITPLETKEFMIDFKDNRGGSGANFIVSYGTEKELFDLPIIESISIGHHGNNGFIFTSDSKRMTN